MNLCSGVVSPLCLDRLPEKVLATAELANDGPSDDALFDLFDICIDVLRLISNQYVSNISGI